ncbi:TM0996/MTH895 family glutaredoxin-like protein [Candidatus Bipolaricaulota bacterium]|nr:TM0996/MTH895 family glutaredoxin-like protein [Candidatus Bipolaricaulota bacterium]
MRRIEVFGTGCPKCRAVVRNAEQAVAELGVEAEVVKVDDLAQMAVRGVMMTPALAIDGKLVAAGRVVPATEIKNLLAGHGRS